MARKKICEKNISQSRPSQRPRPCPGTIRPAVSCAAQSHRAEGTPAGYVGQRPESGACEKPDPSTSRRVLSVMEQQLCIQQYARDYLKTNAPSLFRLKTHSLFSIRRFLSRRGLRSIPSLILYMLRRNRAEAFSNPIREGGH